MKSVFTLNTKAYNFQGFIGDTESWGHIGSGVFIGRAILKHVIALVNKGAAIRQNWNLKVPVVAESDSACACAGTPLYENTVSVTSHFSTKSTTADRQDILDQLDDLIADADFRASFVNGNYLS